MNETVENADLAVFVAVVRRGGFAAAAEQLGMSPAYVSKRISVLEAALQVRLFQRTTRRIVITEEGERIHARALAILEQVDQLIDEVGGLRDEPRGRINICSSFGFGRTVVAPALAKLSARYPALQVRFDVFDRLIDAHNDGFDLDIRIGDQIAPHLVARRLLNNARILCASPDYLARHGTPLTLGELSGHQCLAIKERDHPIGVWRLTRGSEVETVKVGGGLTTNHGEIALQWAVEGAGIVLRSQWDAQRYLVNGQLVQVLPDYRQEANVWAVYPQRLAGSAKVQRCIEFLKGELAGRTDS